MMHPGAGAGGAAGAAPGHRHQPYQQQHQHAHPLPHPHQLHRDTRLTMGHPQPNSNMGSVGQPMGGMGTAMGVPPPHHSATRPAHPIRAMGHHPQTQHHNIQPMKQMRRPYHMGGNYGAPAPMPPPASYSQPPPPAAPLHHPPPPPAVTDGSSACGAGEGPAAGAPAPGVASEPVESGAEGEGSAGEGAGEAARPPPQHIVANSKEKTPMCLVNELARFNKIKHQYRLTSETGPAHKKIFTVTLRLGETEEYTAEGSSIKRAQHAAATAALAQTRHPFPPPKQQLHHTPPHAPSRHTGAVMPTVELNALAMKLCEPALYTSVPPAPTGPPGARFPRFRPVYPPYAQRFQPPFAPPLYGQRAGYGSSTLVHRVRVAVGERSWVGEGPTPQAARHDAAARALRDLRDLPPPNAPPPVATAENAADLLSMEVKSPVSLVHELALKRNLTVSFSVKSERGPPHMRVFLTACTVGDLETEGEGNGKKVSKKRAAEKMLEDMKQLWPPALFRASVTRLQQQQKMKRKLQLPKKKTRNLIKENGEGVVVVPEQTSEGVDNPISRLAMARHAARARSPQYLVLEERGAPRKREFLVQCEAPPHQATGVGPNKKTAKRRAAHNVLVAMGLTSVSDAAVADLPSTNGPVDNDKPIDNKHKKEVEVCVSVGGAVGGDVRQPVPGVLLMPDYTHRAASQPVTPSNGLSELAATGGSPEATSNPTGLGAKDQLMYLSQLIGFQVQFSDFPKRNHGEYLSLVSLTTEPPIMCHGGGASTLHSHEQCSRAALRALTQMGLDVPPAHDPTPSVPGAATQTSILSNGLNE